MSNKTPKKKGQKIGGKIINENTEKSDA